MAKTRFQVPGFRFTVRSAGFQSTDAHLAGWKPALRTRTLSKRISRRLAPLMFLLLLASCGVPTLPNLPACTVQQAAAGVIASATPRYELAPNQSQPFCDLNLVIKQYEEADAWFTAQTQNNTYAPGLLDGLDTYYAGPLLHETSEMITHYQREGRVAVGHTSARNFSGSTWLPDGTAVILSYTVDGYELLVYSPGEPTPERFVTRGGSESWFVTLVYVPEGQRWKIVATRVQPAIL